MPPSSGAAEPATSPRPTGPGGLHGERRRSDGRQAQAPYLVASRPSDSARTRPRRRPIGVTDAGTLIEHLMTGEAAPDGRERYVAVCGARVLPASLTAPGGFCPLCAGAP